MRPALLPPTVFFLLLTAGFSAFATPQAAAQNAPAAVYTIQGTVHDGKAQALSGASVTLDQGGAALQTTTTAADGSYKFTQVAAGDYVVSGSHACCLRASVKASAGGLTMVTTAPDLVLRAKEAVASGDPVVLAGTVKSTADGKGLAGAHLEIDSYYSTSKTGSSCAGDAPCSMPSGYQHFSLDTDGTGAFDLQVNRGHAYVRATLKAYDTTSGPVDASKDTTGVSVPLRPHEDTTFRLHGVLQDDAGQAVANGWVNAGPDYSPTCPPTADCAAQAKRTETNGSWSYESGDAQWNSTQTKPDGSWELRIAAGTVRVSATAPDHLEAHAIVTGEKGGDLTVNLALERVPPDSVTVGGTVVDRATGKPIQGVSVGAENEKWGSWSNAQTDEQGHYELKAKPGFTVLTFSVNAYAACAVEARGGSPGGAPQAMPVRSCEPTAHADEYLPAVQSFDAAADAKVTRDAKLAARPAATSVFQGYLLDAATGKGIADAVVTFYNEETRDWGSATTDADGSYKISVHAGYYTVRAWAEHHFDAVANPEIAEKATQRLDLTLVHGEKRYGYAYPVMMTADGGAGGAPMRSGATQAPEASTGPAMPSDGQRVYEGKGGGLGPYHAAPPASGKAPIAPVAGLAGLAIAFAFVRRR